MTGGTDLLLELQQAHAFDPVPLRSGVHAFHVPFDDLTGSTRTEAALARAIGNLERASVTGGSGVGKTSMIQHVLADLDDDAAMLRVPVAAEDDATISDPAQFAAHLVRSVVKYLAEARKIDPQTREQLLAGTARSVTLSSRRTRQTHLGLAKWMLDAGISGDVQTAADATVARSGAEMIANARDVVDAIAARGLIPVVVIDDSDTWLTTPARDRSALIAPFFGPVVRTLAEELNASLVVAVHDHYLRHESFPRGTGFIEQEVAIPPLDAPGQLSRILQARVANHTDDLAQVITPNGVAALFAGYADVGGNIRRTLLLAHTALQDACDNAAEVITERHVEIAMTQLRDTL